MHKKDGKVFASLTEVKNRTGDIFHVVDEYGEISLTSYNKIRYKITKVDLKDVLSIDEERESPKKVAKAKSKPVEKKTEKKAELEVEQVPVVAEVVEQPQEEVRTEEKQVENTNEEETLDFEPWDRNNRLEKDFIELSTKPMVTN